MNTYIVKIYDGDTEKAYKESAPSADQAYQQAKEKHKEQDQDFDALSIT